MRSRVMERCRSFVYVGIGNGMAPHKIVPGSVGKGVHDQSAAPGRYPMQRRVPADSLGVFVWPPVLSMYQHKNHKQSDCDNHACKYQTEQTVWHSGNQ